MNLNLMQYKDLDLRKIRIENDLDFAHFTYNPNMCSCCYGPKNLSKRYWKDNEIKVGDDYQFILFKLADNGSGYVQKKDYICSSKRMRHKHNDTIGEYETVYIEWRFPLTKMNKICMDLQKQLGNNYRVIKPNDVNMCIQIEVDFNGIKTI